MFNRILFPSTSSSEDQVQNEYPKCFKDLNLDQIISPVIKSKKDFKLDEYYINNLRDKTVIKYRQDVMKDMENKTIRKVLSDFSDQIYHLSERITNITDNLAKDEKQYSNYLTRGQMLHYCELYCEEIDKLADQIGSLDIASEGLKEFLAYFAEYAVSREYTELKKDAAFSRAGLSTIKYCMYIKGNTIKVRKYEGEADHSEQLLNLFEKFRQANAYDYRQKLPEIPSANHVEAQVLELLAGLYPEEFSTLKTFCDKHRDFLCEKLIVFSKEIQFYIAWLDFIQPLKDKGLSFHYPELAEKAGHIYALNCFDLALALSGTIPVTNDFELTKPEHIMVLTGPNQGGKTTFARAFGQMHFLASLGLCVPGTESTLYLFDKIFTHFEKEEDLNTLNGKLMDDLVRLHEILEEATPDSITIINEIYSSTTLSDALKLGKKMNEEINKLEAPSIVVTFLDELALTGPETVSMMSTVYKDNPEKRTYKIVRKAPDGLAYAMYIAKKHGLSYEQLCGRLK